MLKTRMIKYDNLLHKINDNITKQRVKKDLASIKHLLGRLYKEFSGVSQYYEVNLQTNQDDDKQSDLCQINRINY
jgi:hypothetical protein